MHDKSLAEICEIARVVNSCNVTDLAFTSGHKLEVYLAMSPEQRKVGLSNIDMLDTSGMLFVYSAPTYIPFTMKDTKIDLDIAWYDRNGKLIQSGSYKAFQTGHITCPKAFSYVLETPAGQLPGGDFRLDPIG